MKGIRKMPWYGLAFAAIIVWGASSEVPWLGSQSVVGDTLGTGFFLPAMTCLIVTPLVRGHVRKGAAEDEPTRRIWAGQNG